MGANLAAVARNTNNAAKMLKVKRTPAFAPTAQKIDNAKAKLEKQFNQIMAPLPEALQALLVRGSAASVPSSKDTAELKKQSQKVFQNHRL